jgi:hypothetical protein
LMHAVLKTEKKSVILSSNIYQTKQEGVKT